MRKIILTVHLKTEVSPNIIGRAIYPISDLLEVKKLKKDLWSIKDTYGIFIGDIVDKNEYLSSQDNICTFDRIAFEKLQRFRTAVITKIEVNLCIFMKS